MAQKLLRQPRKETFKCDSSDEESILYLEPEMYSDDEYSNEHNDNSDESYDEEIESVSHVIQSEITDISQHCPESEVNEYFNSIQAKEGNVISKLRTLEPENNFQDDLEEVLEKIEDETNTKSCSLCSRKKRVESGSCLLMGQHISVSGKKGTFYIQSLKKQMKLYSHHAIVKKVVSCTQKKATLILIHFTDKEGKIQLCESEETFNLEQDELYVIEYQHPRYKPHKVVERAERELKQGKEINRKYCLVANNCEHFATWCINGTTDSFQVQDFGSTFMTAINTLFEAGGKIANFILRLRIMRLLFLASDDVASGVSAAAGHLVLGITGLVYLVYCIVMTAFYVKRYRKKKFCWSCLKRQIIALWSQFAVFGLTSIITYLFVHFALPLMMPAFSIPILICLILLSAALIWMVPKLLRKFQSPLNFDNIKVTDISELRRGDIISFPYYFNKLEHAAVVTEVYPNQCSSTHGKISCVHYSSTFVLAKRTIVEETIDVDLQRKTIRKFDYGKMKVFPAHEVVRRARCRIGETKWHMASNRSDHLCYWALTDERPVECREGFSKADVLGNASLKTMSTLLIEKKPVHISEEMQSGDVVQLRNDKGIVVAVNDIRGSRQFELDIVTIKGLLTSQVRLNKETVDLNKEDLTLFRYHSAHCLPMQERVDKALTLRDKSSCCRTQSEFIEMCILIPNKCTMKPVDDLSELHEGDVVIFPYYGLPHYFIVTGVNLKRPTIKQRGELKCIHYSLPDIMSKRTITEDWHNIDLKQNKVTLVKFDHMPTFPPKEIVHRARRRVGEKKWNIRSNRSDHLCHWAVTDKRQCQHENTSTSTCTSKRSLLLETVHLMEEIQLGDVVQLYGESVFRDKGILVGLSDMRDGREFQMDIIMLKDRPRLVQITIDLDKEKLFVQRYNSSFSYSMEERIRRAKYMKDRKSKWWTQKGFIEDCILINTR